MNFTWSFENVSKYLCCSSNEFFQKLLKLTSQVVWNPPVWSNLLNLKVFTVIFCFVCFWKDFWRVSYEVNDLRRLYLLLSFSFTRGLDLPHNYAKLISYLQFNNLLHFLHKLNELGVSFRKTVFIFHWSWFMNSVFLNIWYIYI